MSISSHSLISTIPSGNRNYVTYQFTHDGGRIDRINKLVPSGHDTNADMLSMYDGIEQSASDGEEAALEALAEDDVEITSTMVLAVKYTTAKKAAKKLIRFMMRTRNPYLVIALEPLIIYLRATYTNPQLLNFLDITQAQGVKMEARIDEILDNKSVFTTYDANAEDIE